MCVDVAAKNLKMKKNNHNDNRLNTTTTSSKGATHFLAR